jgi:HlyD family secretion protein
MAGTDKRLITPITPPWKWPKVVLALTLLAAGAVLAAVLWSKETSASAYTTARVDRGTVEVTVSATGTVQAVTTVQVGSQVSGVLAWLGADFKSQVKRGQIIAKLDPAIFRAQVQNQQAGVVNAQAGVQAAITEIDNQNASLAASKANQEATLSQRDDARDLVNRNLTLGTVISGRQVEAAQAQASGADARNQQATAQIGQAESGVASSKAKLGEAKAAVAQAKAQLEQAQLNLDHATIASPIDGVVVSRNVDVGQTVAASLQAPTLFVIANDLTNMQVLASIDEADVGQIHEGMAASFNVDAYPGRTFAGQITQIRLNAQTAQNVVIYTAVIAAANPDTKLLPGMTANITIPVAHADNVLTVANASLRFKPAQQQGQPQNQQGGQTQLDQKVGDTPRPGAQGQPSTIGQPAGGGGDQSAQGQTIWVLASSKKLEPRSVRTGITDGRLTAIVAGDLQEGDLVVLRQNIVATAPQSVTAAGQQPGGAALRR